MPVNKTNHPSTEALRALGLGKLPESQAEAVLAHLKICQDCCRKASELPGDTFVGRLRFVHQQAETSQSGRTVPPRTMPPRGHEVETTAPVRHSAGGNSNVSWSPETFPAPFGRYKILKVLGKGGMGAVYLATDTQLDRQVALKIPSFDSADGPTVLERFHREAKAAATVQHPNICPLHDVGEINGTAYLTMAFIEGKPLSEVALSRPLTQQQSALLVRKLALALQEAHSRGIIHRDLKPANVMIDRRGEPIIMDFGLARRTQAADPRLTQLGSVLGTPAYMPPEQANGDTKSVGPASDIYSLGVIFYELLTGRLPFQGDMMTLLSQILMDEPPPPSTLRQGIDPNLERICLKSMAKKQPDRYGTMADFAAELTEQLRHKPATMLPPIPKPAPPVASTPKAEISQVSRVGGANSLFRIDSGPATHGDREARPIVRRDKPRSRGASLWFWLVGGATAALLLVGSVVYLATRHRDGATHAGTPVPAPGKGNGAEDNPEKRSSVPVTTPVLGKGSKVEPVREPLNVLTEQEKSSGWKLLFDGKTMKGWRGYHRPTMPERWHLHDGALVLNRATGKTGDDIVTEEEHDDFELAFDWKISPGGKSTVRYRVSEGAADPAATELDYKILDNSTAEGRQPETAAASCRGLYPVTADRTKPVGEWNRSRIVVSCNVIEHWLNGSKVATFAVGPTRTKRLKGRLGKQVRGRIELQDQGCEVAYRNLKIRPLERGGGFIQFSYPSDGPEKVANIWQMHFSQDNRLFLGAGDSGPPGVVRLWDPTTKGEPTILATKREVWFTAARFVGDGKRVLTHYSADNNLYLWDAATGSLLRQLVGHQKPILTSTASPDGTLAVSGSEDNSLRLWNLSNGREIRQFPGLSGTCREVVFSPDGKQVLGCTDSALHLWNAATGLEVHRLTVAGGPCRGIFSPDGRSILSFSAKDGVRLWDVASGKQVRVFNESGESERSAAFLPSGREIATWGPDRVLRVWEATSVKPVRTLGLGKDWRVAEGLVFSPDGRRFLTTHDGPVLLRDLATGAELLRFPNFGARALTFSPDGRMAAYGTFRAGVYVLKLPTPPSP